MYALLRRFTRAQNSNQLRSYASFTVQDVLRETSDEAGTLFTRFAKHIAMERYKIDEHVLPATKVRYVDYFPISEDRYFQRSVEKTPATQLPALIIHASSYRPNAPPPKYAMALNTLDAQALAQLPDMDTTTVLETLYAFLFLMPNWLKRTDFYHAAIRRLVKEEFNQSATVGTNKERFVQLCFYMGLQKKQMKNPQSSTYLEKLLTTQLPLHLKELSLLDLALVSNAAYKTSTVITGDIRSQYEAALTDAVLNLLVKDGNDALLINFVKSLRLQRVHDERISQHLARICLEPTQMLQLQPRGLAHIFAYFAEQLWDDNDCLAVIVERLMTLLKPGVLRAKDLATFLWSCAQLNCELTMAQLKQLELAALRKLDHGDYNYFPDNLVDTCLSLCMLGHYSKQLIDAAEELKATQRNVRGAQPKVDSRLTVLRSAVAIEQPAWSDSNAKPAFKELTRAPGYLLKERVDLTEYSKQLVLDAEVEGVDLVCPINGINIPSLRVQTLGKDSRIYFVELLTAQQTLKFSQKPTALINLKCRLLEASGQQVVKLHSGNMADNVKELQQILQNHVQTTSPTLQDEKAAQGLIN